MSIEKMSGLEQIQAILEGKSPQASIAEVIPMKLHSVERGRVVFEAQADERHLNPMGGVHGGFAATVLDSATGCVVHTALEAGVSYATVDLNVKMVRPVPTNKPLFGEGTLIHLSRSLGVSEATLKDADGKLYAHATATCMILR